MIKCNTNFQGSLGVAKEMCIILGVRTFYVLE